MTSDKERCTLVCPGCGEPVGFTKAFDLFWTGFCLSCGTSLIIDGPEGQPRLPIPAKTNGNTKT